jgi:hypothetical protein
MLRKLRRGISEQFELSENVLKECLILNLIPTKSDELVENENAFGREFYSIKL